MAIGKGMWALNLGRVGDPCCQFDALIRWRQSAAITRASDRNHIGVPVKPLP